MVVFPVLEVGFHIDETKEDVEVELHLKEKQCTF